MATVYFDFAAATNGSGVSPQDPKNTLSGFTAASGDELVFRRGTTYTGSLPLVAGTPGKRTKYRAWYHKDGSDDLTKSKPIFNLTAVMSSYSSTNKDCVEVQSLDLRGAALPVASDSYLVMLGHNSAIWNCDIDSNIGGIGCYGKSNVIIAYNNVKGVSYVGAQATNVIGVSDNKDADNITIEGNIVTFKGGGEANCHGIRAETTLSSTSLTNLRIFNNVVSPPTNESYTTNQRAIGIRVMRCPGAVIAHNTVRGMLTGVFFTGNGVATSIHIHHNALNDNLNFGVHFGSDTDSCLVEYNECSRNGTNIENAIMHAYGRGIEFSSAAGQGKCQNHVVRYNVLSGNKNYGGPLDNGSEGVGLGFDDGVRGCIAYGNIITENEGNGVQYYGGPLGAGWTDTSNHCIANFFSNNAKASFKNRRTGGTTPTSFNAHIGMSATIGLQSVVANNVFTGLDTKCGISQTSNCVNVAIANNIFIDVANAISFGGAGYGCSNNIFHEKTITIKRYSTTAVDGSGAPTYPTLLYSGTNDMLVDPMLDANYRPLPGSPAIGAGDTISVSFLDHGGRRFKTVCSIGMYENYVPSLLPAIRL